MDKEGIAMNHQYDNLLNIKTEGRIYWGQEKGDQYHESEPTGYRELNELFKHYECPKNSHFIDVGCGKGRVLFYANHFLNIDVTGIELHPITFYHLQENKRDYLEKYPEAQIEILQEKAEEYIIDSKDNVFYLFNPFSLSVFIKVLTNIVSSLIDSPRTLDLILYYPSEEVLSILEKESPFQFYQTVELPWYRAERDRFVIYRFDPGYYS